MTSVVAVAAAALVLELVHRASVGVRAGRNRRRWWHPAAAARDHLEGVGVPALTDAIGLSNQGVYLWITRVRTSEKM